MHQKEQAYIFECQDHKFRAKFSISTDYTEQKNIFSKPFVRKENVRIIILVDKMLQGVVIL